MGTQFILVSNQQKVIDILEDLKDLKNIKITALNNQEIPLYFTKLFGCLRA